MSDDLLEALTGIVAVATLPAGILAGIFMGGEAAAVVFVVGWFLLVPVLGVLDEYVDLGSDGDAQVDRSPVATDDDADDDALQRLRERYAAGEIDEVEFERRLEALLETEDLDPPPGSGRRPDATDSWGNARAAERERESEAE